MSAYLQIVESRGDGSSVRQHVVATLGRAEDWLDTGKLDQLLQSGARLSETTLVLSALRDGDGLTVDSRRLGAPLIFGRLWRETSCRAVVEGLLAERQFQAVGVALPPLFRRLDAEKPAAPTGPPSPKPRKRRLTPRKRSATPAAKNRIYKSNQ